MKKSLWTLFVLVILTGLLIFFSTRGGIAIEDLRNATYYPLDTYVYSLNDPVPYLKLENGIGYAKYGADDVRIIKLVEDKILFVDLNKDGNKDALVLTMSESSDEFTYPILNVLLNKDGKPKWTDARKLEDDSLADCDSCQIYPVVINSIKFGNDMITVDVRSKSGKSLVREYKMCEELISPGGANCALVIKQFNEIRQLSSVPPHRF